MIYAVFLRCTACQRSLVLRWIEVTQSRMQSAMILKGHPVQHDIQGLLPGSELLAVQAIGDVTTLELIGHLWIELALHQVRCDRQVVFAASGNASLL
jgi:hypothetical protein